VYIVLKIIPINLCVALQIHGIANYKNEYNKFAIVQNVLKELSGDILCYFVGLVDFVESATYRLGAAVAT
jgi:hypothetical protein